MDASGKALICELRHADGDDVRFEYQKLAFTFVAGGAAGGTPVPGGAFARLRPPTRETFGHYAAARGIRDDAALAAARRLYGPNECEIPLVSFGAMLMEHALAPFFVFQVLCVLLWSLDDYWYYSLFTLVMLVVFECTVVNSRLRHADEMRSYSAPPSRCHAFRRGRWEALSSADLLPGDLLALERAPPINGALVDSLCPADVLLLHGSVVANESTLTGESTPQLKEAIDAAGGGADERLSIGRHRASVVLGGTKLLQATAGSQPRAMQPPGGAAVGYVLRTGWHSSQGTLMRTIVYASERMTGNTREAFVFILFLLCFAVAAAGYVLRDGLNDPSRSRFKLVLHCIMIVTSVVPPELPMELSLAVQNSLLALHRHGVYCTEPFRIPLAGKLSLCCFDKTGTLTSDDMVVDGVAAADTAHLGGDAAGGAEPSALSSELLPVLAVGEESSLVLGGCHQLVVVDRHVLGDTMEKAALQAAGWSYAQDGLCVCRLPTRKLACRITQRWPFRSSSSARRPSSHSTAAACVSTKAACSPRRRRRRPTAAARPTGRCRAACCARAHRRWSASCSPRCLRATTRRSRGTPRAASACSPSRRSRCRRRRRARRVRWAAARRRAASTSWASSCSRAHRSPSRRGAAHAARRRPRPPVDHRRSAPHRVPRRP